MSLLDMIGHRRKPRIFICYRRHGEGSGYGGRVADKLVKHFGLKQCFRDIENIEAGVDFLDSITSAMGTCEVLVVVIGPDWTTQMDAHNKPRIQDPTDFVHLEVVTALKRNIRVLPVLVGGAQIPVEDDLPEDLKTLPRRQAHELTDTRWDYDTDQLISVIESIGIKGRSPAEQETLNRRMKVTAAVVLTSVVVLLGVFLFERITAPPGKEAGKMESLTAQPDTERKTRLDAEKRAREAKPQPKTTANRERAQELARRRDEREKQAAQQDLEKLKRTISQLLGGRWRLQWKLGGSSYKGVLVMNGITGRGTLRLRYFHPVYQQDVYVDQDMVLQFNSNKGFFYLKGFNPRFSRTRFHHIYYSADSFRLLQEDDGTLKIIRTCSVLGCARVYSKHIRR